MGKYEYLAEKTKEKFHQKKGFLRCTLLRLKVAFAEMPKANAKYCPTTNFIVKLGRVLGNIGLNVFIANFPVVAN